MLELKRILCPVDFSEFSVTAYRHALSLAQHYRAKLVAQHIIKQLGPCPVLAVRV
jgi:universal stress protein family protein